MILSARHAGHHVLMSHQHQGRQLRVAPGNFQKHGLGAAAGRTLHQLHRRSRKHLRIGSLKPRPLGLEGAPVTGAVGLRRQSGKGQQLRQPPVRLRICRSPVQGPKEAENILAAWQRLSQGPHGYSG